MRIAACFLAFSLWITGGVAASVFFVDRDAQGIGDGSSWAHAFTELRTALVQVTAGEIWVAEGTYTPAPPGGSVSASFVLKSGLAIYGGFGGYETTRDQRQPLSHPTILSGDLAGDDVHGSPWYVNFAINSPNAEHVVDASGTDASAVLADFIITRGWVAHGSGAGIRIINGSPTIEDCVILRNLTGFAGGGGVFVQDGSPAFRRVRFVENYVHLGRGGGLLTYGTSQPELDDCSFEANRVVGSSSQAAGAGCDLESSPPLTLTRCRFVANTAVNFYPAGDPITLGGGLHNLFASPLTLIDCEFRGNLAHAGGGLYTWQSTAILNSVFIGNQVQSYDVGGTSGGGYGGGIASTSFQPAETVLAGCVVAGNSGTENGGVFAANGHKHVGRGSIFWGNVAPKPGVTLSKAQVKGSKTLSYCCVEGLFLTEPGEDPPDPKKFPGCIDLDPRLANLGSGDVRLAVGSPCIDAADNGAFPPGVLADLAGDPRFVDDPATVDSGAGSAPLADMGAYEFLAAPPLRTDVDTISLGIGGTQTFSLDAGPAHAGETYWLLGSATGTTPGTPAAAGVVLPLNTPDFYFNASVILVDSPILIDTLGTLDASGRGAARFVLPPNTTPVAAGLVLHHAYATFQGTAPVFASNPVAVTLVP